MCRFTFFLKTIICFWCTMMYSAAFAQTDAPALAPILIGPYDGSDVVEQQVIWTWFMQSKAGGADIFCDLVVAEILSGQTPEEALRQNPPVILRKNLTTSAWQTGFNARELHDGSKYAWQVIAKVKRDGAATAERIVSTSEIWTFLYQAPKEIVEEKPEPPQSFIADTALPPSSAAGEESHPDALSTNPLTDTVTVENRDTAITSDNSAFAFDGAARLTLEHSNQRPILAASPPNFARWQIDPTIKLFGSPLRLNFLLSTESLAGQQAEERNLLSRGAIGSQNVRSGLNLALRQQLDEEINRLESKRDSASIDTLRTFSLSDSLAIASRLNELYEFQNTDLSQNMEALQQFGLASEEQKVLSDFPAFGFGNVAPRFGKLLLNNVTVNGGFVEYNPSSLYVAGSIGKVQRLADISNVSQDVIESDSLLFKNQTLSQFELFRNLYSMRVGFGKVNSDHIILTGLYAEDDEQSVALQNTVNRIRIDTALVVLDSLGEIIDLRDSTFFRQNTIISKQKNYGIGAVAHYEPPIENLTLDGEANLMYFEDKGNFDVLKRIEPVKNLPDFLRKGESDSTITDYSFAAKAIYTPFKKTANFSTGIRYVGGGYRSVGTAGLRTDALRWDGLYTQTFFKKQFRLSVNSSLDQSGFKDLVNSSDILSTGAGIDVRIPQFPAFHLGYQRHAQSLKTNKNVTELKSEVDNAIDNVTTNLTYLWGSNFARMSSFASYNFQNGSSNSADEQSKPDSVGIFTSQAVLLSQQISFGPQISLGITGNYTKTRSFPLKEFKIINPDDSTDFTAGTRHAEETAEVSGFGVSVITNPFSWIESSVGATYFDLGINSSFAFHSNTTLRFLKDFSTDIQLSYRRLPGVKIPEEIVARIVNNYTW